MNLKQKTGFLLTGLAGLVILLACGLSDLGVSGLSDCEQDLDQETVDRLTLSLGVIDGAKQLQPGQSHDYAVGTTECCYYFEEVPACVAWRIDPEIGAEIEPDTGLLRIDNDTTGGSVFTVEAEVTYHGGSRVLTNSVTVYTPESNPLVGFWTETAQHTCESAFEVEFVPEEVIAEVQFTADGDFTVTWYPFEVYKDYWGTYTYDLETGALELIVESGNYIPEGLDTSGFFGVDEQGRLVLSDIWLGSPPDSSGEASCGHVLE